LAALFGIPSQNTGTQIGTHWNALQHTATHCNTLQHTTTHCNIPQRHPELATLVGTPSQNRAIGEEGERVLIPRRDIHWISGVLKFRGVGLRGWVCSLGFRV